MNNTTLVSVLTGTFFAFATSAHAIDLGTTGFSLKTTLEAEYNITDEAEEITLTPELKYNLWNIDLAVDTDIDLQAIDEYNLDLTWTASKIVGSNIKLFGEMSTDDEWDRDDVTVGVSFSF